MIGTLTDFLKLFLAFGLEDLAFFSRHHQDIVSPRYSDLFSGLPSLLFGGHGNA
jgi:hypothetical protein